MRLAQGLSFAFALRGELPPLATAVYIVDADDEIDLLPPSRNYVAPYLPSSQPGAPISQPGAVPDTRAALPSEWDAVRRGSILPARAVAS
jgi:hypothetical protein